MNGQGRWNESSINFGRLEEMFDDWVATMRENRPRGSVWAQATREDRARPRAGVTDQPSKGEAIAVDEYREGSVHVVRAALPGFDPERDFDITAEDGVLRITAERREEGDERAYLRRELRPGRSARTLSLPERAVPGEVTASYHDGILELRIPLAEPPAAEPTRITVTRS